MTTLDPSALSTHGITPAGVVWRNLSPESLYEHTLNEGTGRMAHGGSLLVTTGKHTGRAPKDKFIVREPSSEDRIDWGPVNQEISQEKADLIAGDLRGHLSAAKALYVVDARVGADLEHSTNVRVVTESPWHALFARTMFIVLTPEEQEAFTPDAVILHAPSFQADPATHGTNNPNFVVLNPGTSEVFIGGTQYAGEIKKSAFSLMNDRLPEEGVLPMHCSANVGDDGSVAVFFGLSGTGKTTLSTDSTRPLIGDDEHGWGSNGVFNIEGGCYAKIINLSPEAEPEIYATTRMFGTVIENAIADDDTRILDLDDDSLTENTRAAYPLESVPNSVESKQAGHPSVVVMLTADAFGVLPPIAKLSPEQAMEMFLAGYTARVAGTEVGVTEPQATFSTCFGAPFLPQRPRVYADMLGERIKDHDVSVWLVNTGWTGGPYGEGHRMPIKTTRALVRAAVSGKLNDAPTRTDENFGFEVPTEVPDADNSLLDPRATWKDPSHYDEKAQKLASDIKDAAAKARQR
ncbi:MAG: phosphoenolpyruvate carboxykinase (ATP) [Thermoleophilia bacterium]|nr:phosphoenolpyruvate carboxykinase (ATP) [Thermoleophilia bacterium]